MGPSAEGGGEFEYDVNWQGPLPEAQNITPVDYPPATLWKDDPTIGFDIGDSSTDFTDELGIDEVSYSIKAGIIKHGAGINIEEGTAEYNRILSEEYNCKP